MKPEILNPLFCHLSLLKGVGPKTQKYLSSLCGEKIIDLAFHLPIQVRKRPVFDGKQIPVSNQLVTFPFVPEKYIVPPRKTQPLKIIGKSSFGEVELVFFNYHNIKVEQRFPLKTTLWVSGMIQLKNNSLSVIHPDFIRFSSSDIPIYEQVYPLTAGINNIFISKLIHTVLTKIPDLPEWLEESILKKHHWKSWKDSLLGIHYASENELLSLESPLRQRLAYDELLANQLALKLVREKYENQKGISCPPKNRWKLNLPFELTTGQKKVIAEISQDLLASNRMSRLLQGDVGAGKTVVALISALQVLENGYQVALMAPTDILARQHFSKIQQLFSDIPVKVALFTAREKGKKRQEILTELKEGDIQFIVGTHALIEDNVQFKNLALSIIDEQHRFGVNQRLELAKKQPGVNLLLMSATPIPRSLAMTIYGDMDISVLDEKPLGRKSVRTSVLSNKNRMEVMEKLKNWCGQVYWVCPLVEESEKSDLMAVKERFYELQKFFGHQVGLVHGKMKSLEKEAAMSDFVSGKTKILVSTTVIEVGVDVPNASLMIVEHAERFGLATLHQLRGRIGRGTAESVCLLMYGKLSNMAKERLSLLRSTEDGFKIAEADLRMRGAGEILGWRQSGLQNFRLAQLPEHQELLEMATEQAKQILKMDPDLTSEVGKRIRTLLYLFQKDASMFTMKAG